MIFVHDEPILKKKAFSSPRLKKFRRGSGGRAPAMAPQYAADRDATFQRWPSMHRKSGRYPSWGVFREQRGKFVVNWTSCATFFRPISPFTTAWGILLK